MTQHQRWLGILSTILLTSCATMQEGPPVELAEIAVPKVVSEAATAPKPTGEVSPPEPWLQRRGGFRAWVPRTISANGDVVEGHYVTVSDKAPAKELVKPDYAIPKAPKQALRRPEKRETTAGAPPAQPSRPQGPPIPLPAMHPQQENPHDPIQP